MIALCYVSRANSRFNNEQLTQLLKECHLSNEPKGITGLLLYNGSGTFLQVLEGEADIVDPLYLGISNDDRHSNVHCISRTEIEKRNFPDWKMGFRNLSNTPITNLKGFSHFMEAENPDTFLSNNASIAESMLLHFKSTSNEITL